MISKIHFKKSHLINTSMTARLVPPTGTALLLAGIRKVPSRIQGQSSSQFRTRDSLWLFHNVSMSRVHLSPLVGRTSLNVPDVLSLRRRWGTQVDSSNTLNTASPIHTVLFSFLRTGTSPSASPGIRFHMINRVGERERRRIQHVRIRVVCTQFHRTRTLTVRCETLVTRRRNVAKLGDGDLRSLLRFGFGDLVVGVPEEVG